MSRPLGDWWRFRPRIAARQVKGRHQIPVICQIPAGAADRVPPGQHSGSSFWPIIGVTAMLAWVSPRPADLDERHLGIFVD
jgi:hypothetical protein